MTRNVVPVAVIAAAVALAGVAAPVAAQQGDLSLSLQGGEVAPGENVTVTFTLQNNANQSVGAIVNLTSAPDGWTVANHTDGDGLWREDQKWLFQTVPAGGSVAPSITFSVPDDASGPFTVEAQAETNNASVSGSTTLQATGGAMQTTTSAESEADGGEGTSALGPGFGAVAAVVALLAVALLARRQ
jgi:PGF-CTERM protein